MDFQKVADSIGAMTCVVSVAIGCQIEDDCRNVRTALRIADEKMYEDKRKYYEKKRRNEAARTHPADSGNAGDKG